jgi:alkylation response protein AidB-like acyl-CoA dehydrogenase
MTRLAVILLLVWQRRLVAAPEMACRVVDRAIRMHGAAGLSQDTRLASLYARLRSLRIVDGPDEVHWHHRER